MRTPTSKISLNLLMALTYFITGMVSLSIFEENSIITIVPFAAEGFALAGVLIYGPKILPGIFFGQLILGLYSGVALIPVIGIALGNTLEAYLAYHLFRYFKLNANLIHLKDLIGLFLMITLLLQPISALIGNSVLYLYSPGSYGIFFKDIFLWWFGNIMGQILFTPVLLLFYYHKDQIKIIKLISTTIFVWLLNYFLQIVLEVDNLSLLLLFTLPATLYLSTKDLLYASYASVIFAISSLYFTHLDSGAFVKGTSHLNNIIDLNFFMLSHIILVLLVGVLFKEKEEALKTLRSMAHYDALTGLPNRYLLREEIHHTVYLAHEYQYENAVCYIDIDEFKDINDTLGHAVGDELLKAVTQKIKSYTKSEDALLRIGGDEFLLIINRYHARSNLEMKLQQILDSVSQPLQLEGHSIEVSLSIGVAICPKDGTTVEDLMNASDDAMYEAKKRGKNRFFFAENIQRSKNIKAA